MMQTVQYPIPPVLKGRNIVFPQRTGYCLWCGKNIKEVNDLRRTSFCCKEHSELYVNHFDWQGGLRSYIMKRDNYSCVKCGYKESDYSYIWKLDYKERKSLMKKKFPNVRYLIPILEVDHIIPIAMGGDPFDRENLQTLCEVCHKEKTKEDLRKIAYVNSICRELREYFLLRKQREKMEDYWKNIFSLN
ncbi:MAG: HNH endonuclease [Candidatus Hodarchaeota archaeon]